MFQSAQMLFCWMKLIASLTQNQNQLVDRLCFWQLSDVIAFFFSFLRILKVCTLGLFPSSTSSAIIRPHHFFSSALAVILFPLLPVVPLVISWWVNNLFSSQGEDVKSGGILKIWIQFAIIDEYDGVTNERSQRRGGAHPCASHLLAAAWHKEIPSRTGD